MSEPAEAMTGSQGTARDTAAAQLIRTLNIDPTSAETLVGAGYRSVDEVRALSDSTLQALGIQGNEIERLRQTPSGTENGPSSPPVDSSRAVARFMESVRKSERPRRRTVGAAPKDSTDVLKKWVDGDDRALEDWIQASEIARPSPTRYVAPSSSIPAVPSVPMSLPSEPPSSPRFGPPPAPTPSAASAQILEREATVVHWLTDLLDRVKSDQFDPASVLQEVQDLQRQLYEERARHKQLEEELEHVKRGSIAVIKYVRSREAKTREQVLHEKEAEIAELRLRLMAVGGGTSVAPESSESTEGTPTSTDAADGLSVTGEASAAEIERRVAQEIAAREHDFVDRETELRRRIVQFEGEVRTLRSEAQVREQRTELLGQEPTQISTHLKDRIEEAETRERDLALRETELRAKFEEIRIRAEEVERQRASLQSKEKDLLKVDEELAMRRRQVEEETRHLEDTRREASGAVATVQMGPQLESMKSEVSRLQRELDLRDQSVRSKLQEIETLQTRVSQLEEEVRPAEQPAGSGETGKVHSGVRRLDDLLFGGLPPGCQTLVNGPAHTGKEVLARLFMAEGLKQGIPALWVVTDKTHIQIRDEMMQLLPSYPNLEQQGMVRYVDLYSRSLGVTQSDPWVRLLASTDKGVLDQIISAVNSYSSEFKERGVGYRLVFESVSTVTAYLDTTQMFRFLQPFSGRRKLEGAASYYLLETGMHTESDLQTLEHMTDGSINLKIDQLKTFLSIRGIAEVQSRAWIGYSFGKKSFNLGSFSLDKIR